MKSKRVIISGIAASLALAMVLSAAAPSVDAACGSCGAAGKTAHSHAVEAGTGYSALQDAAKAGAEAAAKAKKNIGKCKPKIVLVFGMAKNFDQAKALEGVTSVFDANLVYGCAGYNTITEEGNAGTVSVLALGGEICVTPVICGKKDLTECGKMIGQGLKKASQVKASGKVVVLIGDCHVPSNDKVVKGISSVIGDKIPVVGGAAMGGTTYCKGKIAGKGKNIGIMITGDFTVGCSTLKEGPAEVHANKLVAAAGQAMINAVGKNLKHTAMVFAFDCGGRRGRMGKDRPKELEAIQKVIGTKMPLIGFYGSGEMGPKACGQPSAGVGYHISACALINK